MQNELINFILSNYVFLALLFSLATAILSAWKLNLGVNINDAKAPIYFNFWLTLVSSLTGWFSLHLIINSYERIVLLGVSFADIFLLLVVVLGLIGLLPTFLVHILNEVAKLLKKIN